MLKLTFLGTSGAFNGAGRANSCYWIDDGDRSFCVDFGPTALMQAKRLLRDLDRLDFIVLTHLHGDHIGGLPQLLLDQEFERARKRPLKIVAPPDASKARIEQLMEATYPGLLAYLSYPLEFIDLNLDGAVEVLRRKIWAIKAVHDSNSLATSLRIETQGRSLAFSGDTGWQDALIDLSAGADAFLCECTGEVQGYWGHLSVEELRAHRAALTPKRLVLTHMGEGARRAARALTTSEGWEVAEDGLFLTF
ncbi:MBL fold metallo-hydrolase [Myxococcota bacterium]|nr:MBL fold metallo-hydrolase [Myxococcota bacterium]MBU1431177.1 MBL fold metallo-hydrolase [Myxococcota bacterium]MBU1896725.1 MBL fold metallo-hydrolase [Myxococcota bacterium]